MGKGSDLIRREDAIKAVWGSEDINPSEGGMVFEAQSHIDRDIRLIPAAKPKRGEWRIGSDGMLECSACESVPISRIQRASGDIIYDLTPIRSRMKYCPRCGAYMGGLSDGKSETSR